MAEERVPSTGENVFETIDAKLNMFALANGMDLIKAGDSRRLVWFMGGLERGLEIVAGSADDFAVTGSAWPTKTPDDVTTTFLSESVTASDLTTTLEQGIEVTNAL